MVMGASGRPSTIATGHPTPPFEMAARCEQKLNPEQSWPLDLMQFLLYQCALCF